MPKASAKGGYELRDSRFFRLYSRRKLCSLLRVSETSINKLLTSKNLYIRRWKHKKLDQWLTTEPQGDIAKNYRPIDIPDPRLKAIQARIAILLSRIMPPDFLFSPVKGRSYVNNAAVHIGSRAFWSLDVEDYFPSCTNNNVAYFFRSDLQCSADVTAILVQSTTINGCLPQGSPCSPILAYFSNRKMWEEVSELVANEGCKLSLYADDITISGAVVRKSMIWEVKRLVYKHRFKLKASKEFLIIQNPHPVVMTRYGRGFACRPAHISRSVMVSSW